MTDAKMIEKFDLLAKDTDLSKSLNDLLPKVLSAGENAGVLTAEGAALLDKNGNLETNASFDLYREKADDFYRFELSRFL